MRAGLFLRRLSRRPEKHRPPSAIRSKAWRNARALHVRAFPTCALSGPDCQGAPEAHDVRPWHTLTEVERNSVLTLSRNMQTLCRRHHILAHRGNFNVP